MTSAPRVFGAALLAAVMAGAVAAVVAQKGVPAQPRPVKTTPPKEWLDPKTVAKQKKDADTRALFAGTTPVAFTLTANMKAVQADRTPNSTKTFPATIEFARQDGSLVKVDLPIRTRGQVRRSYDTCEFAPLRLEFPKDQVKGTIFDGQHALKLGVHCRNVPEVEQYVLREYAAYRIFNLLDPRSFRARLAKVTYVDTATRKSLGPKHGMLIEDDDDVAKRMEGRLVTQRDLLGQLDRDYFTLMAIFEYMIGNLDVSIFAQHNVKLVQVPSRTVFAVPYDFDYSGLVDAAYALPPPGLGITTVRDRVYRGPCRSPAELEPWFAKFRAIRPGIAPIYDSLVEFDPGAKKKALAYLDEFYRTIDRPAAVKTAFIDHCLKTGLM